MCRYFAPIIQATKGRLMKLATPRDAEFGLRSAPNELTNLVLLLARYVGGRGQLTSNDTAEFLYPELFRSIGTIGHEMMCAAQSFDRSLGDAEYEMMDRFVTAMGQASLLCDLVDAETVGLENALRVIKAHPETDRVGIRVDSGDIAEQCVLYFELNAGRHFAARTIVFEDEVTPETVRQVYDHFRQATGLEPTMLFPGAGGYWWRLVLRDTLRPPSSGRRPRITRTSNSPIRRARNRSAAICASMDRTTRSSSPMRPEAPHGEPLFVKLVEQGQIVYREVSSSRRSERSKPGTDINTPGIVVEDSRLPEAIRGHTPARWQRHGSGWTNKGRGADLTQRGLEVSVKGRSEWCSLVARSCIF